MSDDEQTPREKLADMRNAVEEMRLNSEQWIEFLGVRARQMKAFYDALCREGFSPAQALDIVKARGDS